MAIKYDAPCPDLAALRKRQGLSIEQIADATKISIRYLRAIEAGEWSELPGGVYQRSYVRQYLAAIDCDSFLLPEIADAHATQPEPATGEGGWFGRLWTRLGGNSTQRDLSHTPESGAKHAATSRRAGASTQPV